MTRGPAIGDVAPYFELPDDEGRMVSLRELLVRGCVVLYFYPMDSTPGCTIEACGFRDSFELFSDLGAEVVGISADSGKSHQRFRARHNLPFRLLSDRDKRVREAYGVKKTLGLLDGRETFVIDRGRIVQHRYASQLMIAQHIAVALETVRGLLKAA